ncbi:cleft lip and palate transmembrane protein 1 [Trichogramma pretiosum]|uniref:cleft lip and palate transmembrane protein 1 n=1 Tax=Trichogramma pretiosum TaxID=7493 RepID=UPI0006C99E32|nr:cleft lip and palate transmembrane protein 1 [Trichogramma pretiosum]
MVAIQEVPDGQESPDSGAVAVQNDNAEAANNQPEEEQRPNQGSRAQSFFSTTQMLISRAVIIYFISSFFRKSAPTTQGPVEVGAANIFPNGSIFDLHVYLSESEYFKEFNDPRAKVWSEYGLTYGDWYSGPDKDGSRVFLHKFKPSPKLLNNGSIYLHAYVTENGKSPDPSSDKKIFAGNAMSYSSKMLNKYRKIRYQKTHNLLTGKTEDDAERVKKAEIMQHEIVSHWHPNLTINLVTEQTRWVRGQVPEPFDMFIEFTPNGKFYKPPILLNDFWNMNRDYIPLNETIEELELRLTFQPLSLFKWQVYNAQKMKKNSWMSALRGEGDEEDDSDQDLIKEALLETNIYLIGATMVVSVLHSIFEFLAFKNDIQFWNNRKSLEGLSIRSVFFNVFQSLIVLLYVLDNEANTMVRISCFIGLGIEVWKINKVVDIKRNGRKILGIFPSLDINVKGSYVESSTKNFDRLAFKYLSWVLFPLLGGYAVYSLMYQEHKGWYSFVLNMLYGFLLTFGFIMMTPQLFINYKLKSVAHLPWRMMTYKFLNTFIDDIFAFVIKMPTLYRLGCFRDDIIFFVYLYQKWIYKTDHSRVNEFGFCGEPEEEQKAVEDKNDSKEDKKTK